MRIEVLTVPDCPNGLVIAKRLAEALAGIIPVRNVTVERRVIRTPEEAARGGMHGSPTILIDGRDPFAELGTAATLSCRLYWNDAGQRQGAPSVRQLRAAIAGAADPSTTSGGEPG